MVEILVLNGSQLHYVHPEKNMQPALLIDITRFYQDRSNPEESLGVLKHKFSGILLLKFTDTVSKHEDDAFNLDDARSIRKMVDSRKWKSIYVACNQGISRSPAIAIALDEYLNKKKSDLIKRYSCYNPYVYKVLSKELSKGGR